MPLFRRSDGVLVRDESNVRKMMPYLMRGRNESAVYHEQHYDLTKTRPWLRAYNRANPEAPATLFHLLLFAFSRAFHERPGLNRFISGGRIYQRKHVDFSFAAKKEMDEHAPLVTVKMRIPSDEAFGDFVKRVASTIADARTDRQTTVDKELKLALALPGMLLRGVMATLRGLDSVNLMPASMIESDPMYATAFLGNLGSVGIDNTFHHLYEYGTISFFGVIGTTKKMVVVGRDGQPAVRDTVSVRWTFDERINDGFYCATALRIPQRIVEDPERHIGAVEIPNVAAALQRASQ
jgi:pyruvate/2-oxoglutarate dehydrogenase complex dihydrolipoamide acyltransferase (E2) component